MKTLLAKMKGLFKQHPAWVLWSLVIALELAFVIAVFFFGVRSIVEVPVEKDKSFWTPWVPVIGAMVVVTGALITTYINKRLQQRQFDERERIQQLQFDRQANEALFADVMNRFASDKPILRANAAIRLANIAKKQWPGMPDDLAAENYPFFSDAASQLTVALRMEESRAVSEEVIQALKRMSEFARKADQKLLYIQIEYLVRANRSAKRTFLDALARFVAVCTTDEEPEVQPVDAIPQTQAFFRRLAVVAPFCLEGWMSPSSKTLISLTDTMQCLCELMYSAECQDAIALDRQLRISRKEDSVEQSEEELLQEEALLQEVQTSAARLIDTRIALADSLLALNSPPGLPADVAALKKWRRDPALNLSGCFLSGADLKGVHLEGADLTAILLHSAVLYGAHLASAQLKSSQLQRVQLYDVDLRSACLEGAQLRGANLEHSRLNGSSCDGADLQDANCHDTHFEGASLRRALLQGATFLAATLTGTKLCDAIFEDQDASTDHRANFGTYGRESFSMRDFDMKGLDPERRHTEWWHADFIRFDNFDRAKSKFAGDPAMEFVLATLVKGPLVDERAIEWLQANYETSNENYQALRQRYENVRPKATVDGAPSATAPEVQTQPTDSNT